MATFKSKKHWAKVQSFTTKGHRVTMFEVAVTSTADEREKATLVAFVDRLRCAIEGKYGATHYLTGYNPESGIATVIESVRE